MGDKTPLANSAYLNPLPMTGYESLRMYMSSVSPSLAATVETCEHGTTDIC